MTNSKHTPGPWEIHGGEVYAATGRKGCIATFDGCTNPENNAKLIAAAPDMAEALRNIETWAASPGECTLDVIRACVSRTLAKAGV